MSPGGGGGGGDWSILCLKLNSNPRERERDDPHRRLAEPAGTRRQSRATGPRGKKNAHTRTKKLSWLTELIDMSAPKTRGQSHPWRAGPRWTGEQAEVTSLQAAGATERHEAPPRTGRGQVPGSALVSVAARLRQSSHLSLPRWYIEVYKLHDALKIILIYFFPEVKVIGVSGVKSRSLRSFVCHTTSICRSRSAGCDSMLLHRRSDCVLSNTITMWCFLQCFLFLHKSDLCFSMITVIACVCLCVFVCLCVPRFRFQFFLILVLQRAECVDQAVECQSAVRVTESVRRMLRMRAEQLAAEQDRCCEYRAEKWGGGVNWSCSLAASNVLWMIDCSFHGRLFSLVNLGFLSFNELVNKDSKTQRQEREFNACGWWSSWRRLYCQTNHGFHLFNAFLIWTFVFYFIFAPSRRFLSGSACLLVCRITLTTGRMWCGSGKNGDH